MQIWILTQFYPPEFGAAAVRLSRLARLLAADGHTVTVLTGMPNYPEGVIPPEYRGRVYLPETLDGVKSSGSGSTLRRASAPGRGCLTNSALCWHGGAARDISPPPRRDPRRIAPAVRLLDGWLAASASRRAPVVLNVSDLWPESAVATGALRADSPMVKIAAAASSVGRITTPPISSA